MKGLLTRRLFPVLLLLGGRTMFAVDGQVLINASTVAAAGGFPYRITQPGSYKLSGNLTAPVNKGAIQIEADNVTLDLNGFTVACSVQGPIPAFEVDCIGTNQLRRSSLSVGNGAILVAARSTSYQLGYRLVGLSLNRVVSSTVENIHFDGQATNYNMNGLESGQFSIIRHNTFSGTAYPSTYCPSLVEGNVNGTAGAGSAGTGCVGVSNVGNFALF